MILVSAVVFYSTLPVGEVNFSESLGCGRLKILLEITKLTLSLVFKTTLSRMNSWLIAQNTMIGLWAGVPLRMSGRLICQRLGLNPHHQRREEEREVVYFYNPSACEVDAGESEAQGPFWRHCEFQANPTV